ncbi:uncharacterized protein A1O5_00988 [Cladophialophora psammophila CBS 110553]|uniref:Transcription factor domain-containing protein n=1 Tax=Cladophialophora psammophila CBS 110553 TaxID=1182543 RepID=W9XGL5_9EURO|nr:uncharacterized protein A1O5_00988 [Cladophialophora psammophila CBS 110553]EXJ76480.1 hypothetical protein A1O5_00988 [Cladophialophora psammophila CBS 110553]
MASTWSTHSWDYHRQKYSHVGDCSVPVFFMTELTDMFSRLGGFCDLDKPQTSAGSDADIDEVENLVYDAMLQLLEIASKVQEKTHSDILPGSESHEHLLLEVAALGNNLSSWSARLPPLLRWSPENAKRAPSLYFVMHQQFHTTQALLHGPYGQYGEALQGQYSASSVEQPNEAYSFVPLARSIAFKHALKVAQIFAFHRTRFGQSQFGLFSLTHAATASLVLIANASLGENSSERLLTLQRIRTLLEELKQMSLVYQPAKMMTAVMEHYMENTGVDFNSLPISDSSSTPFTESSNGVSARRPSEHDQETASQCNKKRHISNRGSSTLTTPSSANAAVVFHPPSRPEISASHARSEAEVEDFEILGNDTAGNHAHIADEESCNALKSTTLHVSDNAIETFLWTEVSIEPPLGDGGAQIPGLAEFSPSFLLRESSDDGTRLQSLGNDFGDVFLGYQGENFENTTW